MQSKYRNSSNSRKYGYKKLEQKVIQIFLRNEIRMLNWDTFFSFTKNCLFCSLLGPIKTKTILGAVKSFFVIYFFITLSLSFILCFESSSNPLFLFKLNKNIMNIRKTTDLQFYIKKLRLIAHLFDFAYWLQLTERIQPHLINMLNISSKI